MSDWRDDLPPIPADRIRNDAIREGTRRRAAPSTTSTDDPVGRDGRSRRRG